MTDSGASTDFDIVADYQSRQSYLAYLDHLVINSSPRPLPLERVKEPWQDHRERRRVASLEDVAGVRECQAGTKRWFWEGAAKGNDKSSGVGRRLNWLLKYARRPLSIYICSGKLEQAALITQAMKAEIELNPWMKDGVTVTDYSGHGASGSTLTVLPMNAARGQGIFPDVLVADELSHWQHQEGRAFWDFVLASVVKRKGCYFEVLTNAGYIGGWQWDARKAASASPVWDFFEQPPYSQLASWMDDTAIAEASKGMFPGEVKRLFRNVWIDPGEERGYISLADAEGCVDSTLEERSRGERGTQYFAVVDYGGVYDRCALGILHAVPGTDRVVVDRLDVWQGTQEHRVQLHHEGLAATDRSVQQWIDITLLHFPKTTIVFDPYQCESLAQIYERKGKRVERFEYKAGKRNMRMAQLLRGMVQSRRISWSPRAGLLPDAEDDTIAKELARLILKPTVYGFRFDHESGRHDDRAAVLGMGLIMCVPEIPPPTVMPSQEQKPPRDRYTSSPVPPVRKDWAAGKWNIMGMGRR